MGSLKIKVGQLKCTAPVLASVFKVSNSNNDYLLTWNYDGVDYSYDSNTSITIYVSSDGINYEVLPGIYYYPVTDATVDLQGKNWDLYHFKIKLLNRTCDVYSNVIIKS